MGRVIRLEDFRPTAVEKATFAEIVGQPLEAVQKALHDGEPVPEVEVALAVVYITERRRDPTFTLEQARDTRLGDIRVSRAARRRAERARRKKR